MRKSYLIMVLLGCAVMVGCGTVDYIGTVTEYETAIVKNDDGELKEVQVVAFIDEVTGKKITAYDGRSKMRKADIPIATDQRYMFTVKHHDQKGEMYPIISVTPTDAPVCDNYGQAEGLVSQAAAAADADDDNMIDLSELAPGKGKIIKKDGTTFYVLSNRELELLVECVIRTQDKEVQHWKAAAGQISDILVETQLLADEQETGDDEERDEDQDGD